MLFYRLRSIIMVTFKRLWAQRALTAATTLGLTMAVALFMTVPLYSDAVNFRILEERLVAQSDNHNRPPFAYMFNYIGAWHDPLDWDDVAEADEFMSGAGSLELGLPVVDTVHHFESDIYQIFSDDSDSYEDSSSAITLLKFVTTSGISEYITFGSGTFPEAAAVGEPIEVAISRAFADEVGWQTGETYIAFNGRDVSANQFFEVTVSGIWQATNSNEPWWPYKPTVYDDLMLVAEDAFYDQIAPVIDDEVYLATWYVILDGRRVGTRDVNRLLGSAASVERRLQRLLPNASTLVTPADPLQLYSGQVRELSILLFAFNVPTIGLVLAFVGLVGGLAANQRRTEFAVLRSRGGTVGQLLGVALLESLLLGAVAFVLGTGTGLLLTQFMGRARSFLDFSAESALRVAISREAIYAGLLAIAIAALAQLVPTFTTSRYTIVSYKLIQARSSLKPWWQRAWLDMVLLAIAIYGFYTLQGQGSLVVEGSNADGSTFQNPLLILLPALTIFAVTLLFLRLLPLVMHLASYLLMQTNSITLLQASRYLARSPQHYNTPLILLVLTVSFSVFTASLARTLDFQLYDEAFYETGADINLFTLPNDAGSNNPFAILERDSSFVFLPVSDYEELEGVRSAARVGEFTALARVGTTQVNGNFMGIDQSDFRDTAYWRPDFSRYRFGSLMNALANASDGVLVPERLLRQLSLDVGDILPMSMKVDSSTVEYDMQIVGTFNYFPTWNPSTDEPLFIGNLDALFERAGGEFPYRVWLETDGVLDENQLRSELNRRFLGGTTWKEPHSVIADQLLEPQRQGLFGLLSVGFVAAALLTVLGLFLYAMFSYRRRLVELGVLRAVGLSTKKMTSLIAWELALLIFSGVVLGTTTGVAVSRLYVPFLQVGTIEERVPPYIVEIAWDSVSQVYILFVLLFLVALAALITLALRMRVFMAVKLGETV